MGGAGRDRQKYQHLLFLVREFGEYKIAQQFQYLNTNEYSRLSAQKPSKLPQMAELRRKKYASLRFSPRGLKKT